MHSHTVTVAGALNGGTPDILSSVYLHSRVCISPDKSYGIQYLRLNVDSALVLRRKGTLTLNSPERDTFPQLFVIDTFYICTVRATTVKRDAAQRLSICS